MFLKPLGKLPIRCQYVRNLRSSQRFYALQSHNGYVVADYDAAGNLKPGYCLLQKIQYQSMGGNPIYPANTGLQLIKGQIAYMKPENFVSCQTFFFKYNKHGQKS